jgi:hypothetical protein
MGPSELVGSADAFATERRNARGVLPNAVRAALAEFVSDGIAPHSLAPVASSSTGRARRPES